MRTNIFKNITSFILLLLVVNCTNEPITQTEEATCDNGTFVGTVTLTTQQEVEDFGALCYSKINGNLNIGISIAPENNITDISSLSSLTEIYSDNSMNGTGSLNIYAENLSDLNGLNNLKSIDNLKIMLSHALTNLNGLESLETIKMDNAFIGLQIQGNNGLTSIDGLENLISIGNSNTLNDLVAIIITSNQNLQNLNGLSGLLEANGLIQFWYSCGILDGDLCNNAILNDYCGLQNLFTNGIYGELHNGIINPGDNYSPTIQDIIDGNCSQ
ncbi:MAG: hypothetical protein ACWA5P_14350 [bacterium]